MALIKKVCLLCLLFLWLVCPAGFSQNVDITINKRAKGEILDWTVLIAQNSAEINRKLSSINSLVSEEKAAQIFTEALTAIKEIIQETKKQGVEIEVVKLTLGNAPTLTIELKIK